MDKFAALSTLRRFNDFYPSDKHDSVTLSIKRYYTNTVGTILAKGSVPASIQVETPVYLFGTFDKDGGYFLGNELVPPVNSKFYFTANINSFLSFLSFTGVNNIKDQLSIGDQVIVYADDINFPSYLIWIVISGGRTSYASLLNNPIEGGIGVRNIRYQVDNEIQFSQKLALVHIDQIGYFDIDYIDPVMYKPPYYQRDNFIDLKIVPNINNYSGIYFYMNFECDEINLFIRYKNMVYNSLKN